MCQEWEHKRTSRRGRLPRRQRRRASPAGPATSPWKWNFVCSPQKVPEQHANFGLDYKWAQDKLWSCARRFALNCCGFKPTRYNWTFHILKLIHLSCRTRKISSCKPSQLMYTLNLQVKLKLTAPGTNTPEVLICTELPVSKLYSHSVYSLDLCTLGLSVTTISFSLSL